MRALACVFVILAVAPALADDRADAAFKRGKKLLADKRYADACAAFETSNELDPGIGAKLNIAKCFEEWGKLATALRWYREAEKQATDSKDARLAKIHEHREAVDDDTPRLTLRVAKDADAEAASVLLDGQPAHLGEAIEVDPGAHLVEYTNDLGERKKKVVPVERGSTSDVKLDLPKRRPGTKPRRPADTVRHDHVHEREPSSVADVGKPRKITGLVTGGVGLISLGFAGYLTLSAHADYKSALDAHCGGATNNCDDVGLSITHKARTRANYATGFAIAGTLAIAGGAVLYLTAPHARAAPDEHALYLAPSVDARGGGIVFGGRY